MRAGGQKGWAGMGMGRSGQGSDGSGISEGAGISEEPKRCVRFRVKYARGIYFRGEKRRGCGENRRGGGEKVQKVAKSVIRVAKKKCIMRGKQLRLVPMTSFTFIRVC